MRYNRVLGLFAKLPRGLELFLKALPFILILVIWKISSHGYLLENPQGKLLPSFTQMGEQLWVLATDIPRRADYPLLWTDMLVSLQRMLQALFASATVGFFLGVLMAFYPVVRASLETFIRFVSNIPVIAMLAIIMIIFGTGDLFKFVLIFLGTVFIITRDMYDKANAIPNEQVTKALSLGATNFGTVFRLMVPQLMPQLLSSVRLVLGTAWIYLLASEMFAAQEGLGYRIFLVRRYSDMSTIIPYVMVITALAYLLDGVLKLAIAKFFPWFKADK